MDIDRPKTLHYQRARFATQLPLEYFYSPSHFWIARWDDQIWRVGLTKFASRMLGEMVDYGFEPALDAPVASGQVIGWLEGFKALSDVFAIAEGRFAGVNPALEQHVNLINQDPHGAGWLYAIKGNPDHTCMEVQGYVKILDETIDRILNRQRE